MSEYRLIPLHGKYGEGKFAKVSPEDYDKVKDIRWHAVVARSTFYAKHCSKSKGKPVNLVMHRFLLGVEGSVRVDHKNHDGLDNRRSNIRICTYTENNRNRKHQTRFNIIYKGVEKRPSGSWRARVGVDGKILRIGTFSTEFQAAIAYDLFVHDHFGDFAYYNFPDMTYEEKLAVPLEQRQTTSQYRGVSWNKNRKKWHAYYCANGKTIHLGSYLDEKDAANVAAGARATKDVDNPFVRLPFLIAHGARLTVQVTA